MHSTSSTLIHILAHCGLFKYIYDACSRSELQVRWIRQYLRWRLVSRQFNHFICHKRLENDPFNRMWFEMYCQLSLSNPEEELMSHDDWLNSNLPTVAPLDQLHIVKPDLCVAFVVEHFAPYMSVYRRALDILQFEDIKREVYLYHIVRPRIWRLLVRRLQEQTPESFLIVYHQMHADIGRNIRRRCFLPEFSHYCLQCWEATRKRMPDIGGTYYCSTCHNHMAHHYISTAKRLKF